MMSPGHKDEEGSLAEHSFFLLLSFREHKVFEIYRSLLE